MDKIPKINLELKTVYVEPNIIKFPNIKIIKGIPVFGMSESVRKYFGLTKKQLKGWCKQMSKNWEEKYGN